MFDPIRAARVDLRRKKLREDARSVSRNLRTWEDEVDDTDDDFDPPQDSKEE